MPTNATFRMLPRLSKKMLKRLVFPPSARIRTSLFNALFIWTMLLALVPVSLPTVQAQTASAGNCPALPVTASFPDGTIQIANVQLGGPVLTPNSSPNCGSVDSGATFTLSLTANTINKNCDDCIEQIVVGFSNNSTPSTCVFGKESEYLHNKSATVSLTAPTTPGTYYIAFDVAKEDRCQLSWRSGPPVSARYIAAINVNIPNNSWPSAKTLTLTPTQSGTASASIDQFLWEANGSRWYKFSAGANSKVIITLSGVTSSLSLPVNFDLSLHKDVQKSYNQLVQPSDALQSSAEAAPEAYLPEAYLPEAYLPEAYLPEAYLPEAYLPEAYLPEAYLPEAYLPEAYLATPEPYFGAVKRSLLSISARDGVAPEIIGRNTWDISGDFYIRVKGRNGASSSTAPYRLQVTVIGGNCGAVGGVAATTPATLAPAGAAGQYKSVIVTDYSRMNGTDAEKAALAAQVNAFAARPEVGGVVIDLGEKLPDNTPKYKRVAEANQLADQNKSCPFVKNLVAGEIKQIIDSYRPTAPATTLQYVVLLGPDSVVPFIRYLDQAGLANENTYWPPLLDSSASQATLRNGLVLGQDGYGSSRNISRNDHAFPLPDLAVGRVIETASEINAMLTAYIATNGTVTPHSALVTGYDFVADSAKAVQSDLQTALGTAPDSLITPQGTAPTDPASWTADQLRQKFLNTKHDLIFLAGHFSAFGAMAADYQTRVASTEVESSTLNPNTIVFSVGCHSGYNIPIGDTLPNLAEEPDWAEVFARKGVTSVMGTGFQYGDTELVAYSEKLYLEFSKQLHTSTNLVGGKSTVPIGQALVQAKKRYLASTAQMQGIHEKVLIEAALYGLPMLNVTLNGTTPSTDNSVAGGPVATGTAPGNALGLSTTDYTLNSTLTNNSVTVNNLNDNSTQTAQYFSGTNGVVSNPLNPILPLELRNVSATNTVLRGVGFRGGTYTDQLNVLPLTNAPADEIGRAHAAFSSSTFYPRQPWSINYYDALGGGATRLSVTPAQFLSSGPNSNTGTLRSFPQMNFRLYYSNNNGPAIVSLPPQISNVGMVISGTTANFKAKVTGDASAGIQDVWVTYTATSGSFYGSWQSVNLIRNASDPTLWEGSLALGTTNPQDLRFMVQAANGVGSVTLATNGGAYYNLSNLTPLNPTIPTSLTLQLPGSSGNPTAAYLDQPIIKATLTGPSGPLAGQTVTISISGLSRQVTTDSSGVATINNTGAINPLTLRQSPGSYYVIASFAGTATLIPSSASSPFTITKRPTSLTLSQPGTAQYSDPTGVVATLLDSAGKPVGQRSVFFVGTNLANNQQYGVSAFTDSTGKALLGAPQWPAGSYSLQAYFGGTVPLFGQYDDSLYLPATTATTTASLTITPENATITYTGDTLVPVGSTVHVQVQVNQEADGFPGNLALAQVLINVKDSNNLVVATSTQNLPASGLVSLDLPNLAVGVYKVEASVTGNYFSAPLTTFVVTVHDNTSSGFVTGGGWFISPAGAYLADPTWSGRAGFGFSAKLVKGKTNPTGEIEFEFHVSSGESGEFEFHSTDYTSLSINGSKATFTGNGKVKDNMNYGFTVVVIDGQVTGGGGVDKFGIKIWNKATGQVVYDNTAGSLGPTPIQRGNIMIKK